MSMSPRVKLPIRIHGRRGGLLMSREPAETAPPISINLLAIIVASRHVPTFVLAVRWVSSRGPITFYPW